MRSLGQQQISLAWSTVPAMVCATLETLSTPFHGRINKDYDGGTAASFSEVELVR